MIRAQAVKTQRLLTFFFKCILNCVMNVTEGLSDYASEKLHFYNLLLVIVMSAVTMFANHVHVRYMLSPVRLSSVCLSSVTLVHSTQAVVIFGNISTAFRTLTIL